MSKVLSEGGGPPLQRAKTESGDDKYAMESDPPVVFLGYVSRAGDGQNLETIIIGYGMFSENIEGSGEDGAGGSEESACRN